MEKVEIEDLELKKLLNKCLEEKTHLQGTVNQFQHQSVSDKAQISQLEAQLSQLEDVIQKNVELKLTLEQFQSDYSQEIQELVSSKDYLETLK